MHIFYQHLPIPLRIWPNITLVEPSRIILVIDAIIYFLNVKQEFVPILHQPQMVLPIVRTGNPLAGSLGMLAQMPLPVTIVLLEIMQTNQRQIKELCVKN